MFLLPHEKSFAIGMNLTFNRTNTLFERRMRAWSFGVCLGIILLYDSSNGQSFTSYFSGNPVNVTRTTRGGVCMMGGASENDSAMAWFLRQAYGGDVLVLRASGSNGYNAYMLGLPGVGLNSVESIVCNNASSGDDTGLVRRIEGAEAIWIAGGDQYQYVSYWRNKAVGRALQRAILQRNVPIGGTSAGMAILGEFYFAARNGTLSSANALANPYHYQVTVDSEAFLGIPTMANLITDTHFDNPDRRGRLAVMLARIQRDYGRWARAIACDEYTAVCIDSSGWASVYGNDPAGSDQAWFVQSNCELPQREPENCTAGAPLNWNRNGNALRVAIVPGTPNGSRGFYLGDWRTVRGNVSWFRWSVIGGQFQSASSMAPLCPNSSGRLDHLEPGIRLYPNPSGSHAFLEIPEDFNAIEYHLTIRNTLGQILDQRMIPAGQSTTLMSTQGWGYGPVRVTLSGMTPKCWSEWLWVTPFSEYF